MCKNITETSDTVVWEQERSMMGDRHIRVGSTVYHMVNVPDDVSNETIKNGIKINLMIIEKRKINASIEAVGCIAS